MHKKIRGLLVSIGIISLWGNVYGTEVTREKRLYPARQNITATSMFGYVDETGVWQVEPSYDIVYPFQEGYGIVAKEDKYGAFNEKGVLVIPLIYENLHSFEGEYAIFRDEQGMGLLNQEGEKLTKGPYDFIENYHFERAVVGKIDEGEWRYGYIDKNGDEIISLNYKKADSFDDELALVQNTQGDYQLIDLKGVVQHTFKNEEILGYQEGLVMYQEPVGGLVGYMDTKGEVMIPPRYEWAMPFQEGVAIVGATPDSDARKGLINTSGELIYPIVYNDIEYLGEERVALGRAIDPEAPYKGSIYALGDLKGNKLTEDKFYRIAPYQEGIASVSDGTDTYFMDTSGELANGFYKVPGIGHLNQQGPLIQSTIDYVTYYNNGKGMLVYAPASDVVLEGDRKLIAAKYKPNQRYIVYYPQVEGLEDKVTMERINHYFKTQVWNEGISSEEELDFNYYSNFEKLFYKKDLLSLKERATIFYFGAAHPTTSYQTTHVNLATGELYQLEDLFKDKSNWQEIVQKEIQKQAQQTPYKEILLVAPETIQVNGEQNFYVDETSLSVLYEPYEIGPYAAGEISFQIPYTVLEAVIDTQKSLWQSFHN